MNQVRFPFLPSIVSTFLTTARPPFTFPSQSLLPRAYSTRSIPHSLNSLQHHHRTFDFSTHIPYSPMNILVYSGEGVSRNSLAHTLCSIRAVVGQHYDVMKIDAKCLLTEPWEESTSMLVVPGGRDLPYVRDLSGPVNDRIRNFVQSGGRFFGICAGGYYGSDRITFESGTALEVVGNRELKFFGGECRGTVYPGFVYDSEEGAGAVGIELNTNIFDQDRLGFTETKVYFNGGGYFVDAESTPHTQVLAWYKNEPGQIQHHSLPVTTSSKLKAAIVACHVDRGLAVLSGVHPEYDASLLDPRNPEYGQQPNIVNYLMQKEHERRLLLRNILSKMGLKLSTPEHPSTSVLNSIMPPGAIPGIPSVTPLYLASIQPALTSQLASTLYSMTRDDHQIKEANDTFHLVPSPHHAIPVHTPVALPENADGDIESTITKNIVICTDAPPPASMTPEFDMSAFFNRLRQVRQQDSSLRFGNSLMYGQVVTSTQTMLDKNFELCHNLPDGFVCNATVQVSGRGRGRNSWISPPGCLQFSMVLRHPMAASHASAVIVQYLVALAVVESVCNLPGYEELPLRLKWPNDIYAEAPLDHPSQFQAQDGRPKMIKIGGVLVNSNLSSSEFLLVIGCGVNATNPNPTTSINHLIRYHNKVHDKNLALFSQESLLAHILVKFEQLHKQFLGGDGTGFAQFEQRYYKRWLHSDALVTLTTLTPHRRVRIRGVTLDYGLLRTVEVDAQGQDIPGGTEFRLQPDGNSFDMLKGLITTK
ncbi:biotin holocarboxylase synthetase [Podila humilis]|nr:biotin holocarboxylase synthetase [Podila humilis]